MVGAHHTQPPLSKQMGFSPPRVEAVRARYRQSPQTACTTAIAATAAVSARNTRGPRQRPPSLPPGFEQVMVGSHLQVLLQLGALMHEVLRLALVPRLLKDRLLDLLRGSVFRLRVEDSGV